MSKKTFHTPPKVSINKKGKRKKTKAQYITVDGSIRLSRGKIAKQANRADYYQRIWDKL